MNFSDWITITSILLAVVLATFKYDELEIIRRKKHKKYIFVPLLFLLLSGIATYYHTNQPAKSDWMYLFWVGKGFRFPSSFWPIIWMFFFLIATWFSWKRFIRQRPSWDLLKQYEDYLDVLEPAMFSSLFRKYESGSFDHRKEVFWQDYRQLLASEKWWKIAPYYFKDWLFENPKRFYEYKLIEPFLMSQLSQLPFSHLAKELDLEQHVSQNTPILNVILYNKHEFEKGNYNAGVRQSIKVAASRYFTSHDFLIRDHEKFILTISSNDFNKDIPIPLPAFYFINLAKLYWDEEPHYFKGDDCYVFYEEWTEYILNAAPGLSHPSDLGVDDKPNLYLEAVDKMLGNIRNSINNINTENLIEHGYKVSLFATYQHRILKGISISYLQKVSHKWFTDNIMWFFLCMIESRKTFDGQFDPDFYGNIGEPFISEALKELNQYKYPIADRQLPDDLNYQWLMNLLESNKI